ncbi:MAG: DUF5683 domain-containing protein [Pseudobacter sp.]|uniref:DUF5683 domain-containing protein n=1 Tax=Pseudobacter sp. TaxID=2045420 RepID=UPI003F7EE102
MIRSVSAILLLLMCSALANAKAVSPVLPLEEPVYRVHHSHELYNAEEIVVIYYYDTVPVPVAPVAPVSGIKADSIAIVKKDTTKKHSPRKAAIRSAIFPGWGQFYNKKYWKVPLAWAAVGVPIGLFIYNKNWYDRTRYALTVVAEGNQNNPDILAKVHQQLQPLVRNSQTTSLLNYRSEFRRNMDYSILFGLVLWGLNIVDATVDAHLRDFDVSDDISLRISPTVLPGNIAGVSFVFTLGSNSRAKTLPSLR